MAIQSYADIMARLNNPYGTMTEQPKQTAADDFTKYVQTLLLDPNPQGGMLDRDPFRRQNEIDARIKQEQEAKAAQAAAGVGGGGGMFGGSNVGGSDSGNNVQLTKEQLAFLENETLDQRGERLKRDLFGLKPIAGMLIDPLGTFLTYPKQEPAPVRVATGQTPAQIAQQQRQLEINAIIAQQQAAAEEAAIQRAQAAQARAMESGIPAVTRSGGGSFTVSDGSGGSTTYTGSGGYGGGGSLESTFGGGL